MAATNSTKQYLVNYDSTILYPYTTLDCILASSDPGSKTGVDAIIANLLDTEKSLHVYDPTGESNSDEYVHPQDVSAGAISFLGMYTKNNTNTFIKLETLTTNPEYKDYFLCVDGTKKRIGSPEAQQIEMSDNNTGVGTSWISGNVNFNPSQCAIKLNFSLDQRYFEVSNTGHLEIKNAKEVEFASKIKDPDSGNSIASIKGLTISSGKLLYLTDGVITARTANIGNPTKMIYYGGSSSGEGDGEAMFRESTASLGGIDKFIYMNNGEFKECAGTIGSATKGVYINEGKITALSTLVGNSGTPIYYNETSGMTACSYINLSLLPSPTSETSSTGGSAVMVYVPAFETSPDQSTGETNVVGTAAWTNALPVELLEGKLPTNEPAPSDYIDQYVLSLFTTNKDENGDDNDDNDNDNEDANANTPQWVKLQNSVGIAESGVGNDVFYITGVRINAEPSNNSDTEKELYLNDENEWSVSNINKESYTNLKTSVANKLGYAVDNYKTRNSGIYFKGLKLYQTSDERLKTFTSELKDIDLDELSTIKKGVFYWNYDETKTPDLGVTAQSVKNLFPEIVDVNNGMMSVSYNKLAVVALAAIDKLNEEIKQLKSEIAELKANK